jgi:hypothetical protein
VTHRTWSVRLLIGVSFLAGCGSFFSPGPSWATYADEPWTEHALGAGKRLRWSAPAGEVQQRTSVERENGLAIFVEVADRIEEDFKFDRLWLTAATVQFQGATVGECDSTTLPGWREALGRTIPRSVTIDGFRLAETAGLPGFEGNLTVHTASLQDDARITMRAACGRDTLYVFVASYRRLRATEGPGEAIARRFFRSLRIEDRAAASVSPATRVVRGDELIAALHEASLRFL